jgi:aspartyl-tRNA(Asn)/glutamyl-tRNA(Gln) amidotransferase subunit B
MTITPTIGLEVHVQLATKTKMFCGTAVEFAAEPNSRTCPVCIGMPGVLPVINRRAYEYAVMVGLALNCKIAEFTKWDRKSYYYPDLPKNYQISQYDLPLSYEGYLDIPIGQRTKRIGIIRAHLEEDAGKNVHDFPGYSGIDLNRAGTPLLEIVSKPDIHSAEEAGVYARELQKLVRYLGVSEADMQKGHMRFEPNISLWVQQDGEGYFTPIFEVKNLNSFRALERAVAWVIEYHQAELRRHLAEGKPYRLDVIGKQNWGWRDDMGRGEFQRGKEEAHDYRYFPDPDLAPVVMDPAWLAELRARVPELPIAKHQRFLDQYAMGHTEAETIIADRATADLFEQAARAGGEARTLTKQFISFWSMHANERGCSIAELGIPAERLGELARMTAEGTVNATAAAEIATAMLKEDAAPAALAERMGKIQVRDGDQVAEWVQQVLSANEKAVQDALSNPKKRQAAAGFLRGQVMRLSKGKADPKLVGELIEKRLTEMGA